MEKQLSLAHCVHACVDAAAAKRKMMFCTHCPAGLPWDQVSGAGAHFGGLVSAPLLQGVNLGITSETHVQLLILPKMCHYFSPLPEVVYK